MSKLRVLSSELQEHIGKKVKISGWLHKKRSFGSITFLILRDRHGLTQIIVEQQDQLEKLDGLHQGSVLTIAGLVVDCKVAPGGVEIHESNITVDVPVEFVSPIEIDKPIGHNAENLSTLFEYRILNMRNTTERGIWKIQSGIGDAIRENLKSQDFTEFHSPKLLAGSTEGGAEVFKLDYFGKPATLAQSAQFYKQIMVGSLERVFEFGSTYRAEPSTTTRHMTEFITVDVEMGFISGMQDVMLVVESTIKHACEKVWRTHESELLALCAKPVVLSETFPVITLQELHELCYKETGQDFRREKDPSPAEERWICEYAAKNWASEAVFITGFPASDMKFYHYRSEISPECAERFDLIFRGVEIITGSQREHRYPKLIEQLEAMGGNADDEGFKYYLQAFKYGMPAHGGFGLGLERLTQKIIGLNNVKEATIFPRDMQRLEP